MLKVAVNNYEEAKDCPLRNVLDQLGDKWSFLILAVLEDSPKRFNEIKRQVGAMDICRAPSIRCDHHTWSISSRVSDARCSNRSTSF